jgi:hypothetical protein
MTSQGHKPIFRHLVNEAAFIDKAVFNVWGSRRVRRREGVELGPNLAIGGARRMYARSLHGQSRLTGNPFELRYGRLHQWEHVPPFRLIMRSETVPLSGAQVLGILKCLFCNGFRSRVAQVELTFDLSRYSFPLLHQQLLSQARSMTELNDDFGNATLYAGTARSPWQLRIYQKTDNCVRVEFVLRPAFLHRNGMDSIEDLLRLRNLDLSALARFMKFREDRLTSILRLRPHFWGKELLMQIPQRRPLQLLIQVLRYRGRINPEIFLRWSDMHQLIKRMQRNIIW